MAGLPKPAWRALLAVIERTPQGAISRAVGRMADVPIPRRLRRPVLGAFARAVGADVAEAERPLEAYPTLDAFFSRRLAEDARPWRVEPSGAGVPVDAVVGQTGRIEGGRLLQAKGRRYSAAELLGDDGEAARYDGGSFATFYLAPRHYHRIHAPTGGLVPMARHVPGALRPVNRAAVEAVPDLFATNERVIAWLDGPLGHVAVVAIGATNVGRISTAFDDRWAGPSGRVTNRPGTRFPETRRYEPPRPVAPGDEIMAFHLGSSVVVLFEPGRATLDPTVEPGREVRVGWPLAHGA